MTQLIMTGDTMIAQRPGRTIPIQRISPADKYRALLLLGTRPAIAQALVANLITLAKTV